MRLNKQELHKLVHDFGSNVDDILKELDVTKPQLKKMGKKEKPLRNDEGIRRHHRGLPPAEGA